MASKLVATAIGCTGGGFILVVAIRSNAGPDPSPRLSKQLCFRSQGSLANKLTGEADGGDVDTQLTKMDVVLTFQIEVMLWKTTDKMQMDIKFLSIFIYYSHYYRVRDSIDKVLKIILC